MNVRKHCKQVWQHCSKISYQKSSRARFRRLVDLCPWRRVRRRFWANLGPGRNNLRCHSWEKRLPMINIRERQARKYVSAIRFHERRFHGSHIMACRKPCTLPRSTFGQAHLANIAGKNQHTLSYTARLVCVHGALIVHLRLNDQHRK